MSQALSAIGTSLKMGMLVPMLSVELNYSIHSCY